MQRIAFTGKLRSGKSFAAKYLASDYGFEKVSFSDGLSKVADDYFSHLYLPKYQECPFSDSGKAFAGYRKPRSILQAVGQKLREVDEDVWIKHTEKIMHALEDSRKTKGIVIDDLRQPNEYEWARANGFTIIRVIADEDERLFRANMNGDNFEKADLQHETEQHSDGFEVDYEIVNDGNIAEFMRKLDEI